MRICKTTNKFITGLSYEQGPLAQHPCRRAAGLGSAFLIRRMLGNTKARLAPPVRTQTMTHAVLALRYCQRIFRDRAEINSLFKLCKGLRAYLVTL